MVLVRSCILALACLSSPLAAYEEGDVIVRAGIAYVGPASSVTDVISPTALDGLEDAVSVDSAGGIMASATWMFHRNFGLEALTALPFEHDIEGDGALSAVGKVGETKQLPSALILQFYPVERNATVQPYVGMGWNYTLFFEEDTTPAFSRAIDTTLTTLSVSDSSLELDDADGPVFAIGADWALTRTIAVNASVRYLDIDTHTRVDVEAEGRRVPRAAKLEVSIDPWVFSVGGAMRF